MKTIDDLFNHIKTSNDPVPTPMEWANDFLDSEFNITVDARESSIEELYEAFFSDFKKTKREPTKMFMSSDSYKAFNMALQAQIKEDEKDR